MEIISRSSVAEKEATRLIRGAIDEVYNDIDYRNKKDALLAEYLLKCHSNSLNKTVPTRQRAASEKHL